MAGIKVVLFLLAIKPNVTIIGSENITMNKNLTATTSRSREWETTTALDIFRTMATTPTILKTTLKIPVSTVPSRTSSPNTTSTSSTEVVDISETTTLEIINWKSTSQPSISVSAIESSNSLTIRPNTVTEITSKPERRVKPTSEGKGEGTSCRAKITNLGSIEEWKAGTEIQFICSSEPNATMFFWEIPHELSANMKNNYILALNNSTRLPQYNDTGFYYCLVGEEKRPSHASLKKCQNWVYVYFKDDNHVFVEETADILIVVEEGKKSVLPCRTSHKDIAVDLYHNDKKIHVGVEDILDTSFWKYLPHKGFVLNKSRKEDFGVYTCNATFENHSFRLKFILDVTSCAEFNSLEPKVEYLKGREDDNDLYVFCKYFVEKGEISFINNISGDQVENIQKKTHKLCKDRTLLTGWLPLKNVTETIHYICNVTDINNNISHISINGTSPYEPRIGLTYIETPDAIYSKNEQQTFYVSITIKSIQNYVYNIEWHNLTSGEVLNSTNERVNGNESSRLEIKNLTMHSSGNYSVIVAYCTSSNPLCVWKQELKNFTLNVLYAPVVKLELLYKSSAMVSVKCRAKGLPYPAIAWGIGGCEHCIIQMTTELIENESTVESSVTIENYLPDCIVCIANNSIGTTNELYFFKGEINGVSTQGNKVNYPLYIVAGVSSVILVPLACFLGFKFKTISRKENQKNQEKGLWTAERSSKLFNPNLPYDRQLEALAYDKKWEFPENHLKMGVILGSGQFGVVRKAEAYFILPGETISTVAVKISKSFDLMSMEALKSELKIMASLGQHLNVVNLLGACTKNIIKGELKLIVEYCHFGNLRDYLLSHRQYFINQINPFTGEVDLTQSVMPQRRKSSSSSKLCGHVSSHFTILERKSSPLFRGVTSEECCPQMQLLDEDNTNTGTNDKQVGSTRTMNRTRKVSSINKMKKPFSTQDLLCWSFQVARGMEYLASRKVYHGDLAARNTLLAENNVVKIGDFGLSKKLYKIHNYKEKKHGLVPLKWMAIEYLTDNIYSTESDVWSFGILLWEYFSLGGIPYPGMEADEQLFNKLKAGYRMGPPKYASPKMSTLGVASQGGEGTLVPLVRKLRNLVHNPGVHSTNTRKKF